MAHPRAIDKRSDVEDNLRLSACDQQTHSFDRRQDYPSKSVGCVTAAATEFSTGHIRPLWSEVLSQRSTNSNMLPPQLKQSKTFRRCTRNQHRVKVVMRALAFRPGFQLQRGKNTKADRFVFWFSLPRSRLNLRKRWCVRLRLGRRVKGHPVQFSPHTPVRKGGTQPPTHANTPETNGTLSFNYTA